MPLQARSDTAASLIMIADTPRQPLMCRCMLLHSGCNCGALRYEKGATDGDCTASASRPAEAGGGRPQGSSGGSTVPLPPPPTAQPLTPPPPPPLSSITPGRAVPPQPPVVEPEPSGGSAAEFKNVVSGWSRCRSRAGKVCQPCEFVLRAWCSHHFCQHHSFIGR